MAPATEHAARPLGMLTAPFRDKNFMRLIVFLSTWSFAANIATPFFAVYMLTTLAFPMTAVVILTTASQLSNIAALRLWGNVIDRFSNKAVLGYSAPLFLLCTLAWTFTGLPWIERFTFWFLLVVHILMGVATAGVNLATGNIAMKLSPAGQATSYLAASSVVSASCAAAGPIIGGLCADFFMVHELNLAFTWKSWWDATTVQVLNLHGWTFFFGIAFVVGLISLHRLSFVQESMRAINPLLMRDLLLEARNAMRGLSSVAGVIRIGRVPWIAPRGDRLSTPPPSPGED
jgi:MFS family permease